MKSLHDRVIVKIDLQKKNFHTFSNGQQIRLERGWNNLNKRETQPVNAIVIWGQNIPEGSEILAHHNSVHPVNECFNFKSLSGELFASSEKVFSLPIAMCYLYKHNDKWLPLKGYATALRVFKTYEGRLSGIAPKLLKDTLYITSGKDKGYIFNTVRASDYQIIFQDINGQEGNVIRCRHFEDEENDREELISKNYYLTDKLNDGKVWIGLTSTDAKPLVSCMAT